MKKVTKRLTSSRFLKRYLGSASSWGDAVHLKTDSPFLYTYTRALVELNHQQIFVDTDDLYDGSFEDKILGIQTYYERQWLSRGLTIKYLSFEPREPQGGFVEPDIEIEPDSYRSFSRSRRVQ